MEALCTSEILLHRTNHIELFNAIKDPNVETIERLLKQGANINAADNNGITALHIASMNNSSNIVRILICHGASVDPKTGESTERPCYTPLHYAVERGHEEIVKILLRNSADVNLHTKSGMLPLDIAVSRQYVGIARDLLSHGASVDSQCSPTYPSSPNASHVYTPLHRAIEHVNPELVSLLIEAGADVNAVKNVKLTGLQISLNEAFIGKTLLEHEANDDPEDYGFQTPLGIAMQKGYMILRSSESGSCRDDEYARLRARYEIITKLLLEHGAVFVPENKIFQKGLHAAVKMGSRTIVRYILKSFPDTIVSCHNQLQNNCTLLHTAAKGWNVKLVEFLMRHGANVNAEDHRGRTPIFYVVKEDYKCPLRKMKSPAQALKIAEMLLSNGANVDTGAKNEKTPLHCAVENCHYEMVKLLLMHNACVESHVDSGISPLHVAVDKGHVRIAEALLNNGARVDSTCAQSCMPLSSCNLNTSCSRPGSPGYCPTTTEHCPSSRSRISTSAADEVPVVLKSLPVRYSTPLDCAAKKGHEELVKLLLSKGAHANASGVNNLTPLYSAVNKGHDRIVKLLLDNGFNVDVFDKQFKTALFSAGRLGYDRTIEHILKSRPDVNAVVDNGGHTLLHKAISGGMVRVAELLIKAGSDFNAVGVDGKTLLLHALSCSISARNPSYNPFPSHTQLFKDFKSKRFDKIVECLLEHGARVDPTDENVKNTLLLAIRNGRHTLIGHVLKYCPDVKMLLHGNGTPLLHTAIEIKPAEVARVLIKYGANVNATNVSGKTALHLAAYDDHKVVEMLIQHGANVDLRDEDGRTELHIAARRGPLQVMTVLLEYGADINITSNNNSTALDYAVQRLDFQTDDTTHYEILVKHLIKMEAANLFVSQENLQSIELSVSYGCLYDTCKAECEKVRNTKVAGTRFSFYDILTGFHYARNESVVRTLESLDYEAIFPVYSDWIKNNFKRAQRRIYLLKGGATFLNSSLGYELPADLTMEIFGYLSNFELQTLIEAYTNDNGEKLYEIHERNKRKNNVIMKGFKVQSKNSVEREVKLFLESIAGTEVKLESVRELQGEGKNTYLVRFSEFASKILVMRRKKMLKGNSVFIDSMI